MLKLKSKIEEKEREVNDEKPYCKWLYKYADQVLDTMKYIMNSEIENVPKVLSTYEPEQVNDHSTSKADLIIQTVQSSLVFQCCTVSVCEESVSG